MNKMIVDIPLEQIIDHPLNAEIYEQIDVPDSLVHSMETTEGNVEPAVVTTFGVEDGMFMLVAGHRRKMAALTLGLKTLRCEVREYDDAQVVERDLINANAGVREKTNGEINREIERLSKIYGDQAKARQIAGLKKGEDEQSPFRSFEQNGNYTDEQIAKDLKISVSEVRRRRVISDPTYREKFYKKMKRYGAPPELYDECRNRWIAITRDFDRGKIKVGPAAENVRAMQKEILAQCPKYEGKDDEKETKKSQQLELKFKDVTFDEDTDSWTLAEYIGDDMEIEAGIYQRGSIRVPGFKVGEEIHWVSWDDLMKVAKLKKAA